MARLSAGIVVAAAAITAVVSGPAPATAADPGSDAMTLEIVGLELTPLSFNLGSPRSGPSPSRFQGGLGSTVRLAKLRWSRAYWTLVQAGLFLAGASSDPTTMFFHVGTEAGVVVGSGTRAFELGIGAGAGMLGIQTQPTGCDGSCHIGGGGVFLSPVARYMLRRTAPCSVALVARAEVLAYRTAAGCWGPCLGRGTLFLVGLDLGFGFAPAPAPPPGPLIQAD